MSRSKPETVQAAFDQLLLAAETDEKAVFPEIDLLLGLAGDASDSTARVGDPGDGAAGPLEEVRP